MMRCARTILAMGLLWGFAALCSAAEPMTAEADEVIPLIETRNDRRLCYSVAFSPNGKMVATSFTRVPENMIRFTFGQRPTYIQIYSLAEPHTAPMEIVGGNDELFRVFSSKDSSPDGSEANGIPYATESPLRGYGKRKDEHISVANTAIMQSTPAYLVDTRTEISSIGPCELSWKHKLLAICGTANKSREFGDIHGDVCLWNFESGKQLWREYWDNGEYRSVAFSPDGDLVAAGGGSVIPVVTILEGGQRIVGGGDKFRGRLRIWKTDSGDEVHAHDFKGYEIESLTFSPDGKTLVSGGNNGTIQWWNVEAGNAAQPVRMARPPRNRNRGFAPTRVFDLTFSPDGQLLAAVMGSWNRGGRWGELRVLDSRTGEVKATLLKKHPGPVTCAAFSPDGTKLAAGTAEGIFKVWDVATMLATEE